MDMEIKETLPPNMPEPRGLGFVMRTFVDVDHATDSMTCKPRTGFLVFLNSAPIYWMSKKQTCVETSSFGFEFRMMGILGEDQPTFMVITIGFFPTLQSLNHLSRRNHIVSHTTL